MTKPRTLLIDDLADLLERAHDEFGNLEVVFVGDDDQGQFLHQMIDLAVAKVTALDGTERHVLAFMVNPADKIEARRTLMQ